MKKICITCKVEFDGHNRSIRCPNCQLKYRNSTERDRKRKAQNYTLTHQIVMRKKECIGRRKRRLGCLEPFGIPHGKDKAWQDEDGWHDEHTEAERMQGTQDGIEPLHSKGIPCTEEELAEWLGETKDEWAEALKKHYERMRRKS
jgi:hypothetical protein